MEGSGGDSHALRFVSPHLRRSSRITVAVLAASCVNLSSLLSALPIETLKDSLKYISFPASAIGNIYSKFDSRDRPRFISFVIIAKISSTSAIIFTMMSLIASVIGTPAYSWSGLKKVSICTKIMMSVSWLAIASFAAYMGCQIAPREGDPGR